MRGLRTFFTIAILGLAMLAPVAAHAVSDPKASVDEAVLNTAPAAGAEEGADNHAAAEQGEGGLPQLNIATYPSQIFWLLVMFTVLYVAFSKSVLPAIGAVVHGRENLIKGNLDEAQRLKEQAENIQIAYEKNLDAAKAQAVQAVQDVEAASKKKATDQVDAFRRKSEGEIKSAETRVLAVKDKAMGEMTHVAAEVASIAAEKITGISGDLQKAKAIVDSIAGKAKAA